MRRRRERETKIQGRRRASRPPVELALVDAAPGAARQGRRRGEAEQREATAARREAENQSSGGGAVAGGGRAAPVCAVKRTQIRK
jgi:hypothetical protein